MLTRLHLQNFTVFADANFEFSPGLNVLVGTNGTGKSHVLKVGYALLQTLSENKAIDSTLLETALSGTATLKSILLGDALGDSNNLVRWGSESGPKAVVQAMVADKPNTETDSIALNIERTAESSSTGLETFSRIVKVLVRLPVLIPAKEATTLLTDVEPLMREYKIRLDKTYQEIWNQLRRPRRLSLSPNVQLLVDELDKEVGGQLDNNGKEFFVVTQSGARHPVLLEAEGKRKLATLATLLANGALTPPETTLFWDEPEANLNPALLKKLAAVLAALARQGFQIILATHSLFLLKELHILSRDKKEKELPIRYFGLNADQPGNPVRVTSVNDFELLPDIVALDEELTQVDALEIIFATEDKKALFDADDSNR